VRIEHGELTKDERTIFSQQQTARGEVIDRLNQKRLYELMRNDGTLVIDGIHEALPCVREISTDLSRQFVCGVQVNAYTNFGSKRGFGLHWDDHDVIVVQLIGRKQWDLYGPTRKNPLFRDVDEGQPPEKRVDQVVLQQGDLLYLPRGHWHDVVGLGEASFHLTIGLHFPSGIDLVQWLADQSRYSDILRSPLHQLDFQSAADTLNLVASSIPSSFQDSLQRNFELDRIAQKPDLPSVSLPHGLGATKNVDSALSVKAAFTMGAINCTASEVTLEVHGQSINFDPVCQKFVTALVRGETIPVLGHYLNNTELSDSISKPEWLAFIDELVSQQILSISNTQ